MSVRGRIDPKRGDLSRLDVIDGHKETRIEVGTVHRKRIDLAHIVITVGTPPICTRGSEVDAAVTVHAALALDAGEPTVALVDHEVVALAGAPGHEHDPTGRNKGVQNRSLGPFPLLRRTHHRS